MIRLYDASVSVMGNSEFSLLLRVLVVKLICKIMDSYFDGNASSGIIGEEILVSAMEIMIITARMCLDQATSSFLEHVESFYSYCSRLHNTRLPISNRLEYIYELNCI